MTPDAYLDAHQNDLTSLLRRLVALPTVNPPGEHYPAITTLLTEELRASGLRARNLPLPKAFVAQHLPPTQLAYPRSNVVGSLRVAPRARTLHFNAHYDVVPVSGRWRHGSPFSGEIDRGWIYGRGTADMKGSIASLLLALRALHATHTKPRLNLEVSFTADEETDSALGAGWLVEHGPIQPDYAVVMEGGEGDGICCGHNGVVWLEVTVQGRAAHGSRPELGINALEKMAALLLALEPYKAHLAQRVFTSPDHTPRRPTLNLGGVFSSGEGGKINTVPALARFSIDRRVTPLETVPAVERELRATLRAAASSIPDCRISLTKISENHPCYVPPGGPFHEAFASCLQTVRKRPPHFLTSHGFNDMHFFAHHLRIPTLGYGPGGENCHGVDERASLRELLASAKIYARLLTTFEG